MFNIVIEQLPGKYLYISHNNPAINSGEVIAKTVSKFRFEREIDPDLFVAQLLMNIAHLDSKKTPVFHLGISAILGENSSFIQGVSIPQGKYGLFNENGTPAGPMSDLIEFSEWISKGGTPALHGRNPLVRSEKAPTTFDFSAKSQNLF